MNYMEKAFEPANALYRARVAADTWGHLAPQPRRAYHGTMVLAASEYGGDRIIIRTDFADLPDSPWFFDDLHEWLFSKRVQLNEGGIYEWSGTYTKRKNGTFHFKGTLVERIPPLCTASSEDGQK